MFRMFHKSQKIVSDQAKSNHDEHSQMVGQLLNRALVKQQKHILQNVEEKQKENNKLKSAIPKKRTNIVVSSFYAQVSLP